jgi:hypothetical protein
MNTETIYQPSPYFLAFWIIVGGCWSCLCCLPFFGSIAFSFANGGKTPFTDQNANWTIWHAVGAIVALVGPLLVVFVVQLSTVRVTVNEGGITKSCWVGPVYGAFSAPWDNIESWSVRIDDDDEGRNLVRLKIAGRRSLARIRNQDVQVPGFNQFVAQLRTYLEAKEKRDSDHF